MRHRDLLELIGNMPPGEALVVDTCDIVSAAEDCHFRSEGHQGLRSPLRTSEIMLYADGLKRHAVVVTTNPAGPAITLYKPQEPTT